jgi:hypothetical protein
MTRFCPVCKTKLSKHVPEGYCPECESKCQGPIVALDSQLGEFVAAQRIENSQDVEKRYGLRPGTLTGRVSTDDLGIDILLVTYEELAAIAAERPEINAAMQSLSYQITWKGVPVVAVSSDFIESHARAQVRQGYRVARLQPGLGLQPDDPKWETLAKQEPEKKPAIWAKCSSKWHFFSDPDGEPDCGEYLPMINESSHNRPPDSDICPFCWALTSDRPGCTQISTTEIP